MSEWEGRPYTAVLSVQRLDIDTGNDVVTVTFYWLLGHGMPCHHGLQCPDGGTAVLAVR